MLTIFKKRLDGALRHKVWILRLSCAGTEVVLDGPCGSLPTQNILWVYDNGANTLELEGREAEQLGSLSRDGALTRWLRKRHKPSGSGGDFCQVCGTCTPSREMWPVTQASGPPWRNIQQYPSTHRSRWGPMHTTLVAKVSTECAIVVCQPIGCNVLDWRWGTNCGWIAWPTPVRQRQAA